MCITVKPATISGTRLAGFANNGQHTIFYGVDRFSSRGRNALCFSVPTDERFGEENFIDVSDAPSLTEMLKDRYEHEDTRGGQAKGLCLSLEIFNIGNWSIAVAKSGSASEILEALRVIPADSRPDIPKDILETFLRVGDPVVMGCLKPSSGENGMEDLVFSYVPRDYDTLVLPALDGHGAAPKNELVERDHFVFAGAKRRITGTAVVVDDLIEAVPALEPLLPYFDEGDGKMLCFEGGRLTGHVPNGDVHVPLDRIGNVGQKRFFDIVWPQALKG